MLDSEAAPRTNVKSKSQEIFETSDKSSANSIIGTSSEIQGTVSSFPDNVQPAKDYYNPFAHATEKAIEFMLSGNLAMKKGIPDLFEVPATTANMFTMLSRFDRNPNATPEVTRENIITAAGIFARHLSLCDPPILPHVVLKYSLEKMGKNQLKKILARHMEKSAASSIFQRCKQVFEYLTKIARHSANEEKECLRLAEALSPVLTATKGSTRAKQTVHYFLNNYERVFHDKKYEGSESGENSLSSEFSNEEMGNTLSLFRTRKPKVAPVSYSSIAPRPQSPIPRRSRFEQVPSRQRSVSAPRPSRPGSVTVKAARKPSLSAREPSKSESVESQSTEKSCQSESATSQSASVSSRRSSQPGSDAHRPARGPSQSARGSRRSGSVTSQSGERSSKSESGTSHSARRAVQPARQLSRSRRGPKNTESAAGRKENMSSKLIQKAYRTDPTGCQSAKTPINSECLSIYYTQPSNESPQSMNEPKIAANKPTQELCKSPQELCESPPELCKSPQNPHKFDPSRKSQSSRKSEYAASHSAHMPSESEPYARHCIQTKIESFENKCAQAQSKSPQMATQSGSSGNQSGGRQSRSPQSARKSKPIDECIATQRSDKIDSVAYQSVITQSKSPQRASQSQSFGNHSRERQGKKKMADVWVASQSTQTSSKFEDNACQVCLPVPTSSNSPERQGKSPQTPSKSPQRANKPTQRPVHSPERPHRPLASSSPKRSTRSPERQRESSKRQSRSPQRAKKLGLGSATRLSAPNLSVRFSKALEDVAMEHQFPLHVDSALGFIAYVCEHNFQFQISTKAAFTRCFQESLLDSEEPKFVSPSGFYRYPEINECNLMIACAIVKRYLENMIEPIFKDLADLDTKLIDHVSLPRFISFSTFSCLQKIFRALHSIFHYERVYHTAERLALLLHFPLTHRTEEEPGISNIRYMIIHCNSLLFTQGYPETVPVKREEKSKKSLDKKREPSPKQRQQQQQQKETNENAKQQQQQGATNDNQKRKWFISTTYITIS